MTGSRTRVLVVDDEDDMRYLVRTVIEHEAPDAELVGEAEDATTGFALWRDLRPDVVIVDYLMPDRNGIELAQDICAEAPTQAIVLFTANADGATVVLAEHLGLHVVSKDRVRELPEVLRGLSPEAAGP